MAEKDSKGKWIVCEETRSLRKIWLFRAIPFPVKRSQQNFCANICRWRQIYCPIQLTVGNDSGTPGAILILDFLKITPTVFWVGFTKRQSIVLLGASFSLTKESHVIFRFYLLKFNFVFILSNGKGSGKFWLLRSLLLSLAFTVFRHRTSRGVCPAVQDSPQEWVPILQGN